MEWLTVPAAALLLLWPAIWNRYPVIFADTGTYLSQAIDRYAGWDRPIFYSLAIFPLHAMQSLWPIVVGQALLTAWLLRRICRLTAPSLGACGFLLLIAGLAVGTWLPWLVSEVMPDLLTPLLILALWALAWQPERMTLRETLLFIALATFMIATQQSSVPLSLAVAGVAVGLRRRRGSASSLTRTRFFRPVMVSRPTPVTADQPNPVMAGQPTPVTAGQSNPVMAGLVPAIHALRRLMGWKAVDGRHKAGHDREQRWTYGPSSNRTSASPPFPARTSATARTPSRALPDPQSPTRTSSTQHSPAHVPSTPHSPTHIPPNRCFLAGRPSFAVLVPPLLAVLALCSVNLAAHGRFAVSPFGNVFLLARVLYDGPGMEALQRDCPNAKWRLCAFRNRMPESSDAFLWTANSPLNLAGGPKQVSTEANAIIHAGLRADPLGAAAAVLRNTTAQLVHFASGDGLSPWPSQVTPVITAAFPAAEAARYAAARQQSGTLTVPAPLPALHSLVAIGGTIACILLLRGAWRRNDPAAGLLIAVLVALPANAAITGALSGPHDRYQARLMWLPAFVVPLALASRRPASR